MSGVTANVAYKFSVSCQHFVWLAQAHGLPRIEIDLLALTGKSPGFEAERNQMLLRSCRDFVLREAGRRVRGLELAAAVLELEWGVPEPGQASVPVNVIARLKDSSGANGAGGLTRHATRRTSWKGINGTGDPRTDRCARIGVLRCATLFTCEAKYTQKGEDPPPAVSFASAAPGSYSAFPTSELSASATCVIPDAH